MKKQTMASALSLTAALVAPAMSFPTYALAQSTVVERQFAQQFLLVGSAPVRYTNHEGLKIMGRIYLKLDQTPFTPKEPNLLHAEMTGALYFESDKSVEKDFQGQLRKTWVSLGGDDGSVLVDMIHDGGSGEHHYQIHGCDSTMGRCRLEDFKLYFEGKKVHLDFELPEAFEALVDVPKYVDGKTTFVKAWQRAGYIQMNQTNLNR